MRRSSAVEMASPAIRRCGDATTTIGRLEETVTGQLLRGGMWVGVYRGSAGLPPREEQDIGAIFPPPATQILGGMWATGGCFQAGGQPLLWRWAGPIGIHSSPIRQGFTRWPLLEPERRSANLEQRAGDLPSSPPATPIQRTITSTSLQPGHGSPVRRFIRVQLILRFLRFSRAMNREACWAAQTSRGPSEEKPDDRLRWRSRYVAPALP